MTGVEALMWRLGHHDARFNATMSLIVGLRAPVAAGDLEERLRLLVERVPRLRDRVREPALAVVPPRWEADPCFSVAAHMETVEPGVEAAAAAAIAAPFTAGRPPWRVVVVPGEEADGPSSVVLHLHHSYTDGLGGMRLVAELFDFEDPASGSRRPVREIAPTAAPGPVVTLVEELAGEFRRGVGMLARALPWAGRSLAAAGSRPGDVIASAAEAVRAVQAHAGAATGTASPLLTARSGAILIRSLALRLDDLRHAGRRHGVTVNDIFLAGLLDGLGRYHVKRGSASPSLRLAVPISARGDSGGAVGMHNQIVGAVIRGPIGALDFAERARLIHEMVVAARHQPWAGLADDVAGAGVRIPGVLAAVGAALASLDVVASNVVGPPGPLWLAGVPVGSLIPVGPRSGAAVNATMLSFGRQAGVGLNIDPAAVTDPGLLVDCLTAAFEEGLA
jgi:diacylglycerol O-acyltransferase